MRALQGPRARAVPRGLERFVVLSLLALLAQLRARAVPRGLERFVVLSLLALLAQSHKY